MQDGSTDPIESRLLDLHLNRLEAGQALDVEEAIAASPELARQSRALRSVLAMLDKCDTPEPPADLVDSILTTVENHPRVIRFPQPATTASAALRNGQDVAVTPVLSLREVVAIAACITLFIGVFVPGYFKAQNIARRNLCRNNIQQLYAGMLGYTNANDGYMPYTGYVANASWLPTRVPNVPRVSPTRPLFLLVREGYVKDTRSFICPSSTHSRPMLTDSENLKDFTDFAEPVNNSYSSLYMNLPAGRRLENMEKGMVVIADRNPLFDGRASLHVNPFDNRDALGKVVNSVSHEEQRGQNVIYVGGNGGWYTNSNIGVDDDNIFQAGDLLRYQGTERPASATDTFLVN